jgi:hypothetical protein
MGKSQDHFTLTHAALNPLRRAKTKVLPTTASVLVIWFQTAAVHGAIRTVVFSGDSGPGSLRDTIASSASGDTITFAVSGTITLTSGELVITNSLNISGPGANALTLSGNNAIRIFQATTGTLNLSGLTLANSFAPIPGGAIFNAAVLTVTNCAFSGNNASDGAAIYNALGATLTVYGSTIVSNQASTGGAIANRGSALLVNSTFSGNLANNGSALYSSTLSAFTLVNCTVARNGNAASTYAALDVSSGVASLHDTLIALNSNSGLGGPDVTGAITSQGYNLIGKTNDSSGWVASDRCGSIATPLDPLLGPIQDNGGQTFTLALLPGSPAVDPGNAGGPGVDQRGQVRPYDNPAVPNASGGDGSDIGSYEVGPGEVPTLVVYNRADAGAGSLRQAIANVPVYHVPTITFASNVMGIIILTNGELAAANSMSLLGPGAAVLTVNGNNASRVFNFTAGTIHLSGLTLANAYSPVNPGAAIYNNTVLTLTNCTLSSNNAHDGSGIYNDTAGTLTVYGSTIAGNPGETGAGIENRGVATLVNTTVASNGVTGGVNGCAVYNYGTIALTSCTLAGNGSGAAVGGSFYVQAGTATLHDTLIANNVANLGGPDVAGAINSLGFNLIGTTNNSSGWITSDRCGSMATPLAPRLGPLRDNGGPTFTMALLPGSPAIDAGISAGLTTDQRGRPRPFDLTYGQYAVNAPGSDGSDVGAFELIPPALSIQRSGPSVILAWPTNDSGYVLEYVAALPALPGAWAPVGISIVVQGNQQTVTDTGSLARRFYRLNSQ